MILKPAPERPLMPEQEKQNIARDDWREHKRNQYQGIEKAAPEKRPRASARATKTPTGKLTAVATTATRKESLMAVSSSGVSVSTMAPIVPRTSDPRRVPWPRSP